MMQTDTIALSNLIPCILELILNLQEPSLNKSITIPLIQAIRRRFANFLDSSSDSFDPIPAAASFLDPTTSFVMFRVDMVNQLASAMRYIKQLFKLNVKQLVG
jgi:hypothetical protein